MCAWAEEAFASQLSHSRFTTPDGLPQMQAETVFQDGEGYIWIGTLSGFVRYDGRTHTLYVSWKQGFAQIIHEEAGTTCVLNRS